MIISIGDALNIIRLGSLISTQLVTLWKDNNAMPTEIELKDQKLTYVTDVLDTLRKEREGGS